MGAAEQGADAIHQRWLTIPRALCFIRNGDDVLLMKRAPTRRIFPNRYNGVGGHIERYEDPLTAIYREVREETGLDVHTIRLRGVHNINAGANTGIMMFVFTAHSDSREVQADEREGTLHWIPCDEALTLDLVEDLPYILPRVLAMADDAPPYFVHVSYDLDDVIQMRFAMEAE
ncbi:MAG: hypothetical protein OHK0046_07500 [Anaerolineae bacterium]